LNWSRAWFCIWADHNGHTGCATDMMWLSGLYDYVTGFGSLAAMAFVMGWMFVDWIRQRP
jgi:hypothetical protein